MKDRIAQILEHYQLSSSELAKQIEVQRSTFSHLLSGRNKPSLDLIQKLIEHFPALNTHWLITGEGKPFQKDTEIEPQPQQKQEPETATLFTIEEPKQEDEYEIKAEKKPAIQSGSIPPKVTGVKLKEILYIYSDNTFQRITPHSS